MNITIDKSELLKKTMDVQALTEGIAMDYYYSKNNSKITGEEMEHLLFWYDFEYYNFTYEMETNERSIAMERYLFQKQYATQLCEKLNLTNQLDKIFSKIEIPSIKRHGIYLNVIKKRKIPRAICQVARGLKDMPDLIISFPELKEYQKKCGGWGAGAGLWGGIGIS